MPIYQAFPLFLATLLPLPIHRSYVMLDFPNASSNPPQASARERDGLRGPVSSVEEETIYPEQTLADGSQTPEIRNWTMTEYDRAGRVAAVHHRGFAQGKYSGAEWVSHYTYNRAGQLLKCASGAQGETATELVNHYDDQGRLQSITDSGSPGAAIRFRYDDGRKTRIAVIPPFATPPGNASVGVSMNAFFDQPEMTPALPEGGTATTFYDANDRPTEIQLRDPAGALVSRAVRVHDDRGNLLEERYSMDDPLQIIPPAQQADMVSQSGVSPNELRAQLSKFLGGRGEMYSLRNQYDDEGRKTLTIRTVFNHSEDRTEISYNRQGDVAKEAQSSKMDPGNGLAATPALSETLYSYEYDSHGNWIMRSATSRSLPGGAPSVVKTSRRIAYY